MWDVTAHLNPTSQENSANITRSRQNSDAQRQCLCPCHCSSIIEVMVMRCSCQLSSATVHHVARRPPPPRAVGVARMARGCLQPTNQSWTCKQVSKQSRQNPYEDCTFGLRRHDAGDKRTERAIQRTRQPEDKRSSCKQTTQRANKPSSREPNTPRRQTANMPRG